MAWLILALWPGMVRAQEQILSYDSEVLILENGELEVTERIRVRAEGNQIRRGITRDFPTRYRDRYGNRVRVDFRVLGVERDGRPEPWFTENLSNGVRVNTGNDDFLPVPAEYTYTLRFRTSRQLGFFEDHDELYWNAIGTGSSFPIRSGTAEVRLPEPVPAELMGVEAYTGPQGARGQAYEAEVTGPGVARYRLTEPLGPGEGLTIVLTFPKGVVEPPAATQRAVWFLEDNRAVLVALVGLVLMLAYCAREWWRVGRDPPKGVVFPRYHPPKGHTPGGLRYLRRMRYDSRCFSSDVLALAVAGRLRIVREKRFLKDRWRLERGNGAAPTPPLLSPVAGALFPGGKDSIVLDDKHSATLAEARRRHQKALDGELHPRYFTRNGRSKLVAFAIGVAAMVIAFNLADGYGKLALVAISALMALAYFVFSWLIRAPTAEGRALLDEIEGLRLYLGVAERDELARMPGPEEPPPLDAGRYEALLPFAVALEVEDAWTDKFIAAVGEAAAAAAASRMSWYAGRGPITDMGSFSKAVGSSLTSQISSASRPPGSSSGSGGGGSSGGGGGGGGVGGR